MNRKKCRWIAWMVLCGCALAVREGRAERRDSRDPAARLAFVTYVSKPYQELAAALWIESIRKWAGEYGRSPIYVVLTDSRVTGIPIPDGEATKLRIALPEEARLYPFAVKAFAAARAEEETAGRVSSLAWFDPETLVFRPPLEMDLPGATAAAVNPVHLTNIGQAVEEPVDPFWSAIYRSFGLDPSRLFTVETMVDRRKVRAWLNCGIFAVRPDRGLLREWARRMQAGLEDTSFQSTLVADAPHQTFYHQAIFSTLLVSRLARREIHFFSSGNGYPLFCHNTDFKTARGVFQVPAEKKARRLDDLTSAFHESMWYQHEDWRERIPIASESLSRWLSDAFDRTVGSGRSSPGPGRE